MPWTEAEDAVLYRLYERGAPWPEMLSQLSQVGQGRNKRSVIDRASNLGLKYGTSPVGFTAKRPATVNRSPEEVIRDQARHYASKRERWESKHSGVEITLDDPGPFGIAFLGDPHGDDDGFDFEKFSFDVETVRNTPHLYAANMGDLTNNWIGRLEHLWGAQHVTSDESIEVAEYIVGVLDWMFVILGNHDKWRAIAELLCKKHGVTYVSHGAVFKVRCGERVLTVDARHDHKGRSMYNPSHGQLKRNHRGSQADVIIGGHTHSSAYTLLKNGVTGHIGHAIRVSSYKRFDEFADQMGFDDESISPSVVCVVDPKAPPESFVTVMHDIRAGADYLGFLRSKHG